MSSIGIVCTTVILRFPSPIGFHYCLPNLLRRATIAPYPAYAAVADTLLPFRQGVAVASSGRVIREIHLHYLTINTVHFNNPATVRFASLRLKVSQASC